MSLITKAMADRLLGDAELIQLVGYYDEDQLIPSIFSDVLVPEDAPRPYVRILQSMTDTPWDGKRHDGREIHRPIWCVADNDGSWIRVEAIAERVRRLLHRKPLQLIESSGAINGVIARVLGPVALPTDESVVGLVLTLVFYYTE